MDEKLEFSMRDLGRLARHGNNLTDILEWVLLHAATREDGERATAEVLEGYDER
jgi:hypothetical protein